MEKMERKREEKEEIKKARGVVKSEKEAEEIN